MGLDHHVGHPRGGKSGSDWDFLQAGIPVLQAAVPPAGVPARRTERTWQDTGHDCHIGVPAVDDADPGAITQGFALQQEERVVRCGVRAATTSSPEPRK